MEVTFSSTRLPPNLFLPQHHHKTSTTNTQCRSPSLLVLPCPLQGAYLPRKSIQGADAIIRKLSLRSDNARSSTQADLQPLVSYLSLPPFLIIKNREAPSIGCSHSLTADTADNFPKLSCSYRARDALLGTRATPIDGDTTAKQQYRETKEAANTDSYLQDLETMGMQSTSELNSRAQIIASRCIDDLIRE